MRRTRRADTGAVDGLDGSASQIVQRASMQLAALASLARRTRLVITEANQLAGKVPGSWSVNFLSIILSALRTRYACPHCCQRGQVLA